MEKKILFFDCFSGISGDMTVGALLDLGVDRDDFKNKLSQLKVKGYKIEIKKSARKGIGGTDFNVIIENPDAEKPRNLQDILEIIDKSGLNENIRALSGNIFKVIAEAEAMVHQEPVERIHFHEIGALDSIVDIVGTAVCVDSLNPGRVFSTSLNLGGGFVDTRHGKLPVPAPATLEILKGVPVYSSGIKRELTTPTGAAIIKVLCTGFTDFPSMAIEKTGYGLGKSDLETPNVLRAVMGSAREIKDLIVLETNIDDMNPEIYSYLYPKLFEKGALDVYTLPIVMKKNRPANMLCVLCEEKLAAGIEEALFLETSTLGIRKYHVERDEMERKILKVQTQYGEASVKAAYLDGRLVKISPEYEDCARIAGAAGIPLQKAYQEIIASSRKLLE